MRRPCSRLSSASAAPMRVPPDQSVTRSDGAAQRAVRIAPLEVARHAREPGAEHERLDAGARRDRRLQVLEQHPRVRGHRARDVAHEHDAARALPGLAVAPLDHLSAVAQRGPHGRAQVVDLAAAARRAGAAAHALRRAGGDARQQPAGGRPLGVAVVGEVLVAQELLTAVGRRDRPVDLGRPLLPLQRHRRARRGGAADLPELVERVVQRVAGRHEHQRERLREHVELGAGRAHRRAQGVERVVAVGGVDGGQRAVGGQDLADADARSAGPHGAGQLRDAQRDALRPH